MTTRLQRGTLMFGALVLLALAGFAPVERDRAAPSGTLIVLNKSEASASLIDLVSGKEVARLAVGDGPHEVAVSPDGAIAVVSNYGQRQPGSSLTVLDLKSQPPASAKTIDLGQYRRPHGIEFLADGRHVAVTCEMEKMLVLVDVQEGKVAHAIDTTQNVSHMVVLSPPPAPESAGANATATAAKPAQRAYVSSIGSGSVSVIDLAERKLLKVIQCAPGSEGLDISPDGRELWVGNRQADIISIIDTQTLEVVASVDSASFPIRVKFTPDGRHVLVSNARSGDVAVFDAKQRKELRRIAMKATPVEAQDGRMFQDQFGNSPVPVGVLISRDGTRGYVANTNADIVTVIDLEKWEVAGRIEAGKEPDGLGWSAVQVKPADGESR